MKEICRVLRKYSQNNASMIHKKKGEGIMGDRNRKRVRWRQGNRDREWRDRINEERKLRKT
ncbi:hypothetical protein B5E84_03120 [Lachnoclostridium sp. An14]|nr:hypothetical protein B5E84_03120 [Lachnoclostridium sp. An14]